VSVPKPGTLRVHVPSWESQKRIEIEAVERELSKAKAAHQVHYSLVQMAESQVFRTFLDGLAAIRQNYLRRMVAASSDREAAVEQGGVRAIEEVLSLSERGAETVRVLEERIGELEDRLRQLKETAR